MSSLRESFERVSLPAVRFLSGLPRIVPFLGVLALMVAGILVPGWGWALLALVVLFLLWLLALSWPRLTATERLMRIAAVALVVAILVVRAFPK